MDFVAIVFKFKLSLKIRKIFQFEENPVFYAKGFLFYGVNLLDFVLGKFIKKHLFLVGMSLCLCQKYKACLDSCK